MNLTMIPDDLIMHCFQFLDYKTKFGNMFPVNKYINQLISQCSSWNRALQMRYNCENYGEECKSKRVPLVKYIKTTFCNLKSANLSNCCFIDDQLVISISKYCVELKNLDISISSTESFLTSKVTNRGLYAICNGNLKKLRSLNINGAIDWLIDNDIVILDIISDANFILEELNYGDNRIHEKRQLDKLCASKHRFKKLHLDGFYRYDISHDTIKKMCQIYPDLELLHIRANMNDISLQNIGKLKSLEDLYLSFINENETDQGLQGLKNSKLKRLSLDSLGRHVTINGLQGFENLKYIFLKPKDWDRHLFRSASLHVLSHIKEIELMLFNDIYDRNIKELINESNIDKLTVSLCSDVKLKQSQIDSMIRSSKQNNLLQI
jgi:hypothetical protein